MATTLCVVSNTAADTTPTIHPSAARTECARRCDACTNRSSTSVACKVPTSATSSSVNTLTPIARCMPSTSTPVAPKVSGAMCSRSYGVTSCSARAMITAVATPVSKAVMRCVRRSSIAITSAGESNSTSPFADAGAVSEVVVAMTSVTGPPPPKSADATSATSPAGTAYFNRLRTVPPMSTRCVPLEAMVVSDTGDIESPNVEPARTAPISAAGMAPAAPPAGYRIGPHNRIVPKLVPVAVDTMAVVRKVAATYAPPPSPTVRDAHARPVTSPPALSTAPITPAKSHAHSITMTTRSLMPSSIASA